MGNKNISIFLNNFIYSYFSDLQVFIESNGQKVYRQKKTEIHSSSDDLIIEEDNQQLLNQIRNTLLIIEKQMKKMGLEFEPKKSSICLFGKKEIRAAMEKSIKDQPNLFTTSAFPP
ncbi:hypothetical protein RUM44_013754 [Polyplax serrata]|uniref:Reverse transcriptase domain-containing protein n=1 Tax=Polyplax serrata TaxID=468196 RepID=A0ABR1BF23_POLSC